MLASHPPGMIPSCGGYLEKQTGAGRAFRMIPLSGGYHIPALRETVNLRMIPSCRGADLCYAGRITPVHAFGLSWCRWAPGRANVQGHIKSRHGDYPRVSGVDVYRVRDHYGIPGGPPLLRGRRTLVWNGSLSAGWIPAPP